MKSPIYRNLNQNSFSKELGHLSQGIPDDTKRTNSISVIDKVVVLAKR